jgi:hypothetical protein
MNPTHRPLASEGRRVLRLLTGGTNWVAGELGGRAPAESALADPPEPSSLRLPAGLLLGRETRTCVTVNLPGEIRQGGCTSRFDALSFTDFLLQANELSGMLAGARTAGGQLRAIIDTAGTPPDVGQPRPFNAVIKELPGRPVGDDRR